MKKYEKLLKRSSTGFKCSIGRKKIKFKAYQDFFAFKKRIIWDHYRKNYRIVKKHNLRIFSLIHLEFQKNSADSN